LYGSKKTVKRNPGMVLKKKKNKKRRSGEKVCPGENERRKDLDKGEGGVGSNAWSQSWGEKGGAGEKTRLRAPPSRRQRPSKKQQGGQEKPEEQTPETLALHKKFARQKGGVEEVYSSTKGPAREKGPGWGRIGRRLGGSTGITPSWRESDGGGRPAERDTGPRRT